MVSFLVLFFTMCTDEQRTTNEHRITSSDSNAVAYDSSLAARLGADDYGMRRYVMAFLKAGPNRSQDPEEAAELQRAHLDNIARLAEDGSLIVAGPFLDDSEIRGIYIFAVETVDEARKLSETDPAIQAGSLELELHPWYGSAALMQLGEVHKRISKEAP
ncbi:hypothetical protein DDZ15_04345 [Rhodohalobacter mucosus]|uniref:YCII-related domain-containing protein n=2 Tax=Rhodohalobacter mucosus TaxID=2079485 RepID=A0A316TUH1_9BACT|nr:hypothetical protein DDZ15_04345 [Rhodohalobacter mucosus]